jgi:hypothetical protein
MTKLETIQQAISSYAELDYLWSIGEGESEQAEILRDKMDVIWDNLRKHDIYDKAQELCVKFAKLEFFGEWH